MAAAVETAEVDNSAATKRAIISRPVLRVIATTIVIKVLLFLFAAQSYQIISDNRILNFQGWTETLTRWDTIHYLKIAQHGYSAAEPDRNLLAFFPLYPWITRIFAMIVGNYLISGLLVSTIASIAVTLLLFYLVRKDAGTSIAERAIWFLFIFPTSYFLHLAYPESLFMALTIGCILAARKRIWWIAGLLGAFSCLTRITGLVLPFVLLVEAIEQYREERHFDLRWLWLALVPAGFLCYLIINANVTGDPFAFLTIQKENWHKSFTPPWIGISNTINSIPWRSAREAQMVAVQELIFVMLGLVCTIYCWANLRRSYSVWMMGNWLIFTSTSFIYSVPRYTLTLFPIYILFARVSQKKVFNSAITVWSLCFLALFSSLFVCGYWAF